MQTNREYFNTLTVPQLKSILTDFNAIGFSRMRKAELINFILPLFDGAHLDAMAYGASLVPVKVSSRKGYNERMVNRLFGYHTQNGFGHMLTVAEYGGYDSTLMMSKLTPAQRRRYRKQYNKHYGNLVAQLAN